MDPLLRAGHWQIIGNRTVDEGRIPWPACKVATAPDAYTVTDHLERPQHEATSHQQAALRFLSVVAPIRFENALKGLHGLVEWRSEFDDLLIP